MMLSGLLFTSREGRGPWGDLRPVRGEMFGIERLEQHAASLAAAQPVTARPQVVRPLQARLDQNAALLLAAYRDSAEELAQGRQVVPAAEWLLDNYHLVAAQITDIHRHLPPGYYRQLPKLADGPFTGYPRVFGLAWAYVTHTDSHVDPETLRRFINAYQQVQPLTIGELWAVAITLRIVLIENLRRLAEQITQGRRARDAADRLSAQLITGEDALMALASASAALGNAPLPELYAAQLVKNLRGQDPETTPALSWLAHRLQQQGTTPDEVVLHAQQRLGASNVSVRNVITSMRMISDLDWPVMFESVSLVDRTLRQAGTFAAMDFPTRNRYRSAIEQLARGSGQPEGVVAAEAVALAGAPGEARSQQQNEPGYYLIDHGRHQLEAQIGFTPSLTLRLQRGFRRIGLTGYLLAQLAVTAAGGAALWAGLAALMPGGFGAAGWVALLLSLFPLSGLAGVLVNRTINSLFAAKPLPAMALEQGVPAALRSMVVVPTLLTREEDINAQIEQLEVHYLTGISGDLTFALLTDGMDAATETTPQDAALLAGARQAVAALNARHGPGSHGPRFLLLHRRRHYNPAEGVWMGWERKRGKLHELNRLLRGATDTHFMAEEGNAPWVPPEVRYVITLDADTHLPREVAQKLIGKMAHPLNQPRWDAGNTHLISGYAILQPRVTMALPMGREGSRYQRIFAGQGGIDPYAAAVSDVYQDLFGEGSYTGKGIYDVDAFEQALHGRIPENTLLSHDLFEGACARAGLASDVELVEAPPARYDVIARRQHRWTRGDWQLLPWLVGNAPAGAETPTGRSGLDAVGCWKMIDNLRRSLVTPALLLTLAAGWTLPAAAAWLVTLSLLAVMLLTAMAPPWWEALLRSRQPTLSAADNLRIMRQEWALSSQQALLTLCLLPDNAWRMLDAIARTLYRLTVSRKHLLEWVPAAQLAALPSPTFAGFYRLMMPGTLLALALCLLAGWAAPWNSALILLFGGLWLAAPAIACWVSREPAHTRRLALSAADRHALRLIARQTWRYFETYVTAAEHWLPPDNFQEQPKPVIAHRTSPTNIGLYLLSTLAARDFGWTGLARTVARLEATFGTLMQMPRHNGHFLNWYGTRDLQVLQPAYVSAVDSGNLAGHLLVVAAACEAWCNQSGVEDPYSAVDDHLRLMEQALAAEPLPAGNPAETFHAQLAELRADLALEEPWPTLLTKLLPLSEPLLQAARQVAPITPDGEEPPLLFACRALDDMLQEHDYDRRRQDGSPWLAPRLLRLAQQARDLAYGMDFRFLVNTDRQLLSIGYSVADNQLDSSCYDLLASEARLASLFAIAKGDIATRHWFRLGRNTVRLQHQAALLSWSGSMFEYLMPSLVLRAPEESLLAETNRLVVAQQQAYGRRLGIPWGISESAYNARDLEFTYQYSNFGVPGLGLKRGLAENTVIAPYASGLASMIDPAGAAENYRRMARLGAYGHYGFYEALDFTPSRLPRGERVAVVYNYMAHHQGMTLVALANVLHNGLMRERFHREPAIQSVALLLQERLPQAPASVRPLADEVRASAGNDEEESGAYRHFTGTPPGAPVTHLLSNGNYAVMISATGGGYSRWHDIAVTRWREDSTRDNWGSLILLRDLRSGRIWSACAALQSPDETPQEGGRPARLLTPSRRTPHPDNHHAVLFGEDHAAFTRHEQRLISRLEMLVSGEDDSEVRRITLTNRGLRLRELDLTSYMELVLTQAATDNAHTAFARMFIQTEFLAEYGALIATRRRRTPDEPVIWAGHFVVVEGDTHNEIGYETDRARFIGNGYSVLEAQAMQPEQPLSGTTGTVLDPIFSLRRKVRVGAGKTVRVAFWTVVAGSREALLSLIDKHHDRHAFDRAKTLAWTKAQVQLRHLAVKHSEAADFQRLTAPLLYADPRFGSSPGEIIRGAGPQAELWPLSISGDLPIVLLRIDDISDIAQVKQLLRAHEYWRLKLLSVDLVIVNDRASSYIQDLQIAIDTAVRSSQSQPRLGAVVQGQVYTLRADLMSSTAYALLASAARVVLHARNGPLDRQLGFMPPVAQEAYAETATFHGLPDPLPDDEALEFFNGIGGFANQGREYVCRLEGRNMPPLPWINVVANPSFGFQVSARGSGYTWAENSRDNQLTPWSNDAVCDPSGEAFYLFDRESGALWSPTQQPIDDGGRYESRHGWGYSRFRHRANQIETTLLHFVPLADAVKISRLTVRNLSNRRRVIQVTAYAEWVLGSQRGASAPFVITDRDARSGAIRARNLWGMQFPGRVAFGCLREQAEASTASRREFLGRNGHTGSPLALISGEPLSGFTGTRTDPCCALQHTLDLPPGGSAEVVFLLGQGSNEEDAQRLITHYRQTDLDAVLQEVTAHWLEVTQAVQVQTPDRAMDILLNGWLLYQTRACRIQARCGFYQTSGAYGFRDQLQDGMALTMTRPHETRAHILRAAGRQFPEGDVQHWWLPHSGQGVRTRISDDRVWLAFATATYLGVTQDEAILDESLPFLEGPPLAADQHDAFLQPAVSLQQASLFEHCARGLDQCITLTGQHGLPLIGTGDWNDGMNRVGEQGKGESVWLGWLFIRAVALFAPYARRYDAPRAARWEAHAQAVLNAIETHAWDGEWYRRATFDDGTWLGSQQSEECRIDAIAQSWAVLSGKADPVRMRRAMASLSQQLILPDAGLSLLFTPPFDQTAHDPGYIKGYPPGLRENGGQYTHAAMWNILAYAALGDSQRAASLFSLLNPIHHSATAQQVATYQVEPYVMAADVYSVAPHQGRGGWTWYTGSAGWMYRAGLEGILGLTRAGDTLILNPCLPVAWPGATLTVMLGRRHCRIALHNQRYGQRHATLDDAPLAWAAGEKLVIPLTDGDHQVVVFL
ncbi:GH36-type glycosyl hydrolase domain-containing protein [Chimaeribacter californicus]|nr:glucoamylase family protein [Chimaeribacter californicus]